MCSSDLEVRRLLPAGHPFVERLAAQVELQAGDSAAALALLDAATKRFPASRALVRERAQVLLVRRDFADAAPYLESAVSTFRSDADLWRMLAEAQGGLGETARAHRAAAEQFVLLGATPAAIEQLRLAQRAGQLDFYTGSQVDARLRELQAQWQAEQKERGEGRR